MKNYLSFGGGVNSVAMMLYLLDEGWDFEAVFVNHGTDWPETYEYLDMFQEWLKDNGHKPITVLKPEVTGFWNLYDYCWHYRIVPNSLYRWCTDKFKVRVMKGYYKVPCFALIGFDMDESHRAKLKPVDGHENRFPLLEAEMNRNDCKEYIRKKGLSMPRKSGCYICPFMKVGNWKELRMRHPGLFCKAVELEKREMDYRTSKGKKPYFLSPRQVSISVMVDESQLKLFKQDEYPPCECML